MRTILTSLMVLCSNTSPAKTAELSKTEFTKFQNSIQDRPFLTLDFVQSGFNKKRDKTTVRSKGRGYFSIPDRFYWDVQWPTPLKWISDGEKLVQFVPTEKIATWFPVNSQNGPSQIIGLVTNSQTLLKNFSLASATRTELTIGASLTPKSKKNPFSEVDVTFDVKQKFIRKVVLTEKFGNKTIYEFSKPTYTSISPEKFKIPATVKLVKGI